MQKSKRGDLPSWALSRLFKVSVVSIIALSGVALSLFTVPVDAAYDPPHNEASGVNCGDCHGKTLAIAGGSPFWTGNDADTAYNALCLRCHVSEPSVGESGFSGDSAPIVKSHGSGTSVMKCTACHHNHEQEQIYPGKYNQSQFFVATGTKDTGRSFQYQYFDPPDNTIVSKTVIPYSALSASNGTSQWADLNTLAAKTGAGRGAMLVPDTTATSSRWPIYMVDSIDTGAGTITIKGDVTAASSLGIFYGQLIRSMMECDSGIEYVNFFDISGSKSYTNGPGTGICQVCHIAGDITHWTNDGGNTDHYSGENCMNCHSHTAGFVHGGGGGTNCEDCHGHDDGFGGGTYSGTTQTHSRHTEDDGDDNGPPLLCTHCHAANYPYFNSGTDSNGDGHIDFSETDICVTCHNQKPSWGGSGCLSCHTGVVNNRADIGGQFAGNSHHVQGVPIFNVHCYECHWEAFSDGTINATYHGGDKAHDSAVDLVISGVMDRPTTYDADGLNSDDTAITFTAANMSASLAAERQEVENITFHCLGCHREENNDYMPFDDCKTPRQYAWDRSSINERYIDSSATTWGKYNGSNVAEKAITKALSAHGNAVNNGGGFSVTEGEDGIITNTRDGLGGTRNYNVECFDCHNSHGSNAIGITSSYATLDASGTPSNTGGIIKATTATKGGYSDTYMPVADPTAPTSPYNTGAALCFDCHVSSAAGTLVSAGSNTPWGYNDTFGATASIMGYRDTDRFEQGSSGLNTWTSNNRTPAATLVGGHLKASSDLKGYDGVPGTGDEALHSINGLCTPCHDPHGISPSLGNNRPYAVPLLKGTWMTSPYKEDFPGTLGDGRLGYDHYRKQRGNYFYEGDEQNWDPPAIQKADGRDPGGWRTDRNTFNQGDLSNSLIRPVGYDRITEDPDQFAGLCLGCHPKASLTTDVSAEATTDIAWTSLSRIHRSVQGWGWNDGDPEREHSFTCSKCHQPHISGLPRLMKTNCLNYTHRGQVTSGGEPQDPDPGVTDDINAGGRFPFGWWGQGRFPAEATGICHGVDDANGSAGWPDNQGWNNITTW